jgi:thiol-disulfide isomerase/thioredoxin
VAVGALGGCGSATSASSAPSSTPHVGPHVGELAPAMSGTTIEGPALSLSAWRGSVVVVVFWASWCTPCQAEQPAVDALASQEMQSGVRFAGVSLDVDRAAARSYVARYSVPYDSLIDASQTFALDFEIAGPPTTFVIDRTGRVAAQLIGEVDPSTLRARIAAAQSAA